MTDTHIRAEIFVDAYNKNGGLFCEKENEVGNDFSYYDIVELCCKTCLVREDCVYHEEVRQHLGALPYC